jgi:aryl-alcohol dehydrogenase-like predicted oxidoreductase
MKVSPYVIGIAWHLAKSQCVVPIPGASKIESICSSITAADIRLTSQEIKKIDTNLHINNA